VFVLQVYNLQYLCLAAAPVNSRALWHKNARISILNLKDFWAALTIEP